MIPFNANALITVRDWSITNVEKQGETAMATAEKKIILNGKNYIKTGTAKITPTPSQVARIFGRTAGALALTVAIEQMLGAVDWVIDSANNSITYTKSNQCLVTGTDCPSKKYLYKWEGVIYSNQIDPCNLPLTESQRKSYKAVDWPSYQQPQSLCRYQTLSGSYTTLGGISVEVINNPAYDPSSTDDNQPKSLPLSTIATRVIDNAKTGEPKSQAAIAEAVDQILTDAQADPKASAALAREFDESSETQPADEPLDVKIKGKTTNPDGTKTESEFDVPVACDWMPLVCQAASVVITKPGEWAESIKAAYDDAVDYFKSEPEQTDNTLDIGEENQTQPDTTISFQTSCPAKIPLTFNWNGQTIDFSFDFTIWCESISTFVYPIVVALGSLHALYIVAGVRQDG